MPRIYIACLIAYEGGHQHGCWTRAIDVQAIRDAATAMLRDSPIANAQAWFILDVDGFDELITEYDLIERIAEVGAGIYKHGPAFVAYAFHVGPEHATLTGFQKYCQTHRADAGKSITLAGVPMPEAPLTAFTPVQAFGIDP
jgi:antirestriction protein